MKRLLPCFIGIYSFFGFTPAVFCQCGYSATIATNNNYCVGSSLIARSAHALQNIVWYKNGQPVQSVMGSQALASTPTIVNVLPVGSYGDFSDIGTDGAANIYLADGGNQRVLKWAPGGGYGAVVAGPVFNMDFQSIFVDKPGNVYILSGDSGVATVDSSLVMKYAAGSGDSTTVITKSGGNVYTYGPAESIFRDCQGDIYIYSLQQQVTKWTPDATSGILVAGPAGGLQTCEVWGGLGRVRVDKAGNIFFMVGNGVQKMAPGAARAVSVTSDTCLNPANRISDFWLDANDTLYQDGINVGSGMMFIQKWAPGASSGQTIANIPVNQLPSGRLSMTMDIKGNFYLAGNASTGLFELKRFSAIDSAYAPTDTGAYYAVVTDIQGYTTTTDTIMINAPLSGPPPSIKISATADSTAVCTPITFTADPANPGPDAAYQWMVSGVKVGGDSTTYTNNLFANGDQVYCVMAAQDGCAGPITQTSNLITLGIDPHGAASVTIAAPKTSICQGDTVDFTATVTNGSSNPVFEWLLNGANTSDDSAGYVSNNFSTGDVMTCLITSDDVCGLAKSNSITLSVSIPPIIAPGQVFVIPYGKSLTLDPVFTGDVSSWLWTPAIGLSDPHIVDPVADPSATILYTLTAFSPGGCNDSAGILVNVYTPLNLPNAFTPNGDGHNDRFYVLSGPVNSVIEEFSVFNRWGQAVFQAQNAAPGDIKAGWNGRISGVPAAPGAYVYVVVMKYANGTRQTYKGTVILIR